MAATRSAPDTVRTHLDAVNSATPGELRDHLCADHGLTPGKLAVLQQDFAGSIRERLVLLHNRAHGRGGRS